MTIIVVICIPDDDHSASNIYKAGREIGWRTLKGAGCGVGGETLFMETGIIISYTSLVSQILTLFVKKR